MLATCLGAKVGCKVLSRNLADNCPSRPKSFSNLEVTTSKFARAGMLDAEHLAALRIDTEHDVPDGAIFSRCIHRLKDQQHGVAVVSVKKLCCELSCATCSCKSVLY